MGNLCGCDYDSNTNNQNTENNQEKQIVNKYKKNK